MTIAILPWIETAFALALLCSAYRLLRGPSLPIASSPWIRST